MAAGAIAIFAAVLVIVGTFLPIVEFNGLGGAIDDSLNGWGNGINDGPIHFVVCLIPLVMGVLALMNRARVVVKVLLIISALIGFFWVAIRFADISGSLENGSGAFVAAVADPGIGLYLITFGWVLVLVAGIVAKAGKPRAVSAGPYAQPYQPPPVA